MIIDGMISEDDISGIADQLHVLTFCLDGKKQNVVAYIGGMIGFIDRYYAGETVRVGDTWVCTAQRSGNVYYVMPVLRIDASMVFKLSETARKELMDAVWEANREDYEKRFAEEYRDEIYSKSRKEAKEAYDEAVKVLQAEKDELQRQLALANYMISTRAAQEDEIELSSEPLHEDEPAPETSGADTAVEEPPVKIEPAPQAPQRKAVPPYVPRHYTHTPGMPEMRVLHSDNELPQDSQEIEVLRVGEETLRLDAFPDGRYFAHISFNGKYLVLRKHNFGSALCIGHRMRLKGLGKYSKFESKARLPAEYSPRHDGVLVHLAEPIGPAGDDQRFGPRPASTSASR